MFLQVCFSHLYLSHMHALMWYTCHAFGILKHLPQILNIIEMQATILVITNRTHVSTVSLAIFPHSNWDIDKTLLYIFFIIKKSICFFFIIFFLFFFYFFHILLLLSHVVATILYSSFLTRHTLVTRTHHNVIVANNSCTFAFVWVKEIVGSFIKCDGAVGTMIKYDFSDFSNGLGS